MAKNVFWFSYQDTYVDPSMFKREFIKRQEYLLENGPRTNFSFTPENYFPLKIEY